LRRARARRRSAGSDCHQSLGKGEGAAGGAQRRPESRIERGALAPGESDGSGVKRSASSGKGGRGGRQKGTELPAAVQPATADPETETDTAAEPDHGSRKRQTETAGSNSRRLAHNAARTPRSKTTKDSAFHPNTPQPPTKPRP